MSNGCHVRNKTKMGSGRPMNLQESLNRVYTIHVYGKKGNSPKAVISVPPVLAGFKVKLVPIKKNG